MFFRILRDRRLKNAIAEVEVKGFALLDILSVIVLHLPEILEVITNPRGLVELILSLLTRKQEQPPA